MPSPFARELGRRLREARTWKGLTLKEIRTVTDGRFNAVTVGSYERGDRAVRIERLRELASVYGVDYTRLIPSVSEVESGPQ